MQPDAQLPLLQKLQPRKVAVFRALQLGDMLCAIPALRALRIALPHAHITLVGLPWAEQFVRRFPHYIDDFIAFPGHPAFPEQPVREGELESFYNTMRERRYDLAIQLHGSGATSNSVVAMFGAAAVAGYVPAVDRADGEAFPPYPEPNDQISRVSGNWTMYLRSLHGQGTSSTRSPSGPTSGAPTECTAGTNAPSSPRPGWHRWARCGGWTGGSDTSSSWGGRCHRSWSSGGGGRSAPTGWRPSSTPPARPAGPEAA